MNKRLLEAHRLAQLIETVSAKRVAATRKGFRWEDYYDPLTATALGELIYSTMTGQRKRP